ncbi:MAG TPA: hypothetical protein VFN22_03840 [Gemmatimonadales bacterium]|nr:hypothetical protein [Gemmatimonadales bacterium]
MTRRVRALIDYAHEGNIREASVASGLAYGTLRDLYTGKTTNPGVETLERLGRAYSFYGTWFTDPNAPEEIPSGGIIVQLREMIGAGLSRQHRDVLIPMAAWPLPWVLGDGMLILENLPPSSERPILGVETDEDELNIIMVETVLHPLLVAERAGLIPDLPSSWDHMYRHEDRDALVPLMRHIGRCWKAILLGYQARLDSPSK